MTNVLTALTEAAVSVFHEKKQQSEADPGLLRFLEADPVLADAQRVSHVVPSRHPALAELTGRIFAEPELANLGPREGELSPMVMTPYGGSRTNPEALVTGLFSAAFLQMHWLRLPENEGTFVRTVLEGFDELRRAARGEAVRAYVVTGIAGVTLPEGSQISTPWGVVRPATKAEGVFWEPWRLQARCILADARLIPVHFDRAAQPKRVFEPVAPEQSRVLFPLACALASKDTAAPAAALLTWSTSLLPFQGGLGYSMPYVSARFAPNVDLGDSIAEVEEWARLVDKNHSPSVDVAANRLVSAIAQRMDQSDALIDAVTVWENLVGTRTEVTFRVTAALAKMLETDPVKRRSLRRSLGEIYDTRSRVVHGEAVEPASVQNARAGAVDAAVRVLRVCYRKGPEWLGMKSSERADSVLLEWP